MFGPLGNDFTELDIGSWEDALGVVRKFFTYQRQATLDRRLQGYYVSLSGRDKPSPINVRFRTAVHEAPQRSPLRGGG